MPNTPKLEKKDLEQIEREANLAIKRLIWDKIAVRMRRWADDPGYDIVADILKFIEDGMGISEAMGRHRSYEVKDMFIELFRTNPYGETFQKAALNLYDYFEGNQSGASHQARMVFLNFKSYTEMALMGMEFFQRHLRENKLVFSYEVYKQWLLTVQLGVKTAPDYYVLGVDGLNYPDTLRHPSPRLEALKTYLKEVYIWRKFIALFDNEIHRWTSGENNSFSADSGSGIGGYRKEFYEVLLKHFDEATAKRLIQEIFAASPPPGTNPHHFYQQRAHELIVKELLPKESEQSSSTEPPPSTQDGFNRDYAKENEEREKRERERKAKEEKIKEDIGNIPPTMPPNPDKPDPKPEQSEQPQPPPTFTGFNSQDLNEAINKMNESLRQDSEKSGHNQPFTPSPGLGMPLNSIMKEEAEKLPWLVMGFNLDTTGTSVIHKCPHWSIKDPATAAALQHGEGDYITLLLCLFRGEVSEDAWGEYRDFRTKIPVLHNFFWAKNLGTDTNPIKGYQRLVKDEEASKEKEQEQLLIAGRREEDQRANKLGWNAWPWDKELKMMFGVPGVKQKSWRFTRWARTYDKAFELDDRDHFIGILKDKGLFGGFKVMGNGRVAGWGNGPRRSILWITNQLKYRYETDYAGDDINTINPDNNFSHYLIFSNYSTQEIKEKFLPHCKTLAELVGKLKGVMVRLGPDALELIDSQDKDQKERSEKETPESRDANRKEPTDQDLKDMGLTRKEFDLLNTAFADPAHIANVIKKVASSNQPEKVAEMLDRMFEHLKPETRDNMFKQMVDHNPIFSEAEKQKLKDLWEKAQTKEEKKKVWQLLTSHQAQREAHKNKTQAQKDKIFEDQVNQNPRYGPPGEDTQDRRDRFEEYTKADDTKKEKMQEEENERFTVGENANQWGNYFQDNANRECGAGDESVGTETDNNFNGQFSFADSLQAINKLKNIGSMKQSVWRKAWRLISLIEE